MLIQANKVMKNFGGVPLFENVNLVIQQGEKIGLIGSNGSGKTTLFNILTGAEGVDAGTVSKGKDLKIGYIQQHQPAGETDVLTYILSSYTEIVKLKEQLQQVAEQLTDPQQDAEKLLIRYGRLQERFEADNGYVLEDQVMTMLKGLGLAAKSRQSLTALSGGERVRVELAKSLTAEADLLLLDEPTNHLDLTGIQWLENYLKHYKGAFVVISHDRQFLDNVVTKMVELEDGMVQEFSGNYSRYRELKQAQLQRLQKDFELQQKEIQRLKNLIRQFRQWGNESDNEKFYKKAKMYEKRLAKIQIVKKPAAAKERIRRPITEAERSGKEVLTVAGLGQLAGERLLFADSSFTLYRQERVVLLGANGSGKTTLLRLLLGELVPDEGKVSLGSSVKLGYLPQKILFEQEAQRLVQYAQGLLGNEQKAREELARFGFYRDDVTKRLQDLSGGERVRLYLLQLFQAKINFLILDEPTNHLDIEAREEIEEILADYQETLLVVSHDRYFLRKNLQQSLRIHDQKIVKNQELQVD